MSQTVMQTSVVPDDLLDNPTRCAAAHNQQYIIPVVCPTVPKMLQRTHDIRLWRIHPWQFVYEHHFPPIRLRFQQLFQCIERIEPVFQLWHVTHSCFAKRCGKLFQLQLLRCFLQPCMTECKMVMECLFDQICLSHASSSVQRDKLRLAARIQFL